MYFFYKYIRATYNHNKYLKRPKTAQKFSFSQRSKPSAVARRRPAQRAVTYFLSHSALSKILHDMKRSEIHYTADSPRRERREEPDC